jgi:hypothetical protein
MQQIMAPIIASVIKNQGNIREKKIIEKIQ